MTEDKKITYEFDHDFVQDLVSYLTQRPYGEVYPFLDKLRLEIKAKEAPATDGENVSGIYVPGTK